MTDYMWNFGYIVGIKSYDILRTLRYIYNNKLSLSHEKRGIDSVKVLLRWEQCSSAHFKLDTEKRAHEEKEASLRAFRMSNMSH